MIVDRLMVVVGAAELFAEPEYFMPTGIAALRHWGCSPGNMSS
ncbi:hypothetical protein [Gracilimonas sp.]